MVSAVCSVVGEVSLGGERPRTGVMPLPVASSAVLCRRQGSWVPRQKGNVAGKGEKDREEAGVSATLSAKLKFSVMHGTLWFRTAGGDTG